MVRSTADVIRGAEKQGRSDQWAWVSELSKCHCYSDLWKHTENNPHCTCNLHSKVSMEKHVTKGSNPVTGQGQARVRGGADTSRLLRHNAVISTFPPPMQVANDSAQRVSKTRKCCAFWPWPFHPHLMFAFGVISIDWVYLCIRHKNKADRPHRALSSVPSLTSIKLWFESLTQSLLLSSRVRTRGELWRENKLFALACSFTFGDCLFAWVFL